MKSQIIKTVLKIWHTIGGSESFILLFRHIWIRFFHSSTSQYAATWWTAYLSCFLNHFKLFCVWFFFKFCDFEKTQNHGLLKMKPSYQSWNLFYFPKEKPYMVYLLFPQKKVLGNQQYFFHWSGNTGQQNRFLHFISFFLL